MATSGKPRRSESFEGWGFFELATWDPHFNRTKQDYTHFYKSVKYENLAVWLWWSGVVLAEPKPRLTPPHSPHDTITLTIP